MDDRDEYVELQLVASSEVVGPSEGYLCLEVSIEVDVFKARGAFLARPEIVAEFLEQLENLTERRTPSAKFECALVEGEADVLYFACQIEPVAAPSDFVAQVSLGTAGSNGLLHRLHVGLELAAVSVTLFRRDLQAILTNRSGTAVLRRWREAQPNQRSMARVSSSERSKERARRG